ncbi:hypothetical protein, partial [Aliivibrio finisterrensis]
IKRTQDKYQIRDVQVSHLLTLSEELLLDNFIEYFETLPSNYKKSFKSAWRQREHKLKNANEDKATRTVELSSVAYTSLQVLLELYKKHDSKFNYSIMSKQEQTEYILEKSCDSILSEGIKKKALLSNA